MKKKDLAKPPKKAVSEEIDLKKIFLTALAVYALLIVSFYFLAGEQLRFRESRGNISLPQADAGTVELTPGAEVEQIFYAKIQRLETVSVEVGGYYRENHGI